MKIGIIGLGIMGVPMAKNIMGDGFELKAANRTPERFAPLEGTGATFTDSPRELAEWADVLVLMLTGPEAIDAMLFGTEGAAGSLGLGKTVVNMSTVPPSYTCELAELVTGTGASFVDAPVSGSKKPAEDGTLVILAGGRDSAIDAVEPVLLAMGSKVVRCGPTPAGSMMKMSVNLLLGAMMEGLAEMLNFGLRGGLSMDTMLEVVLGGPLSSGLFQLKEPMFHGCEFPPQFPAKHMAKDLKFVVDTAYETGARAPSAYSNLQLYRRAMAKGWGDDDFATVFRVLREGDED